MTAQHPYVPYSHCACDQSPGESVEVPKKRPCDQPSPGYLLIVCRYEVESGDPKQTRLEGACRGLVTLQVGLSSPQREVAILTLALSQAL